MKHVLVLQGHPKTDSFCGAMAKAYASGAESAGHSVEFVELNQLDFALSLKDELPSGDNLEPDLVKIQESITRADHVVLVYPTWWGSAPALVKGFIDRTLTVGYAFRYSDKGLPVRLLKGRSMRLITTMDGPLWVYRTIFASAQMKIMGRNTFRFCGFGPFRTTIVASLRTSSDERREKWLTKASRLGEAAR